MHWARMSHIARLIPKAATSRSIARASTTATSILARRPAIRTSSASWPVTPSRGNSRNGTTVTSSPCTKELGAFDADGLFIADGTYLFVPDNPRYEGSQRLLFDEHNHPVSKKQEQEMTKAQRARCRWRRCYKAVLLLHCDAAGERFVVAGVRVLREKES